MDMDKLVSLCKRRGFLFQSSEIYGGFNGFWDYGPLGVELKRNVKEAWWRDMVAGHDELTQLEGAPSTYDMVGLDCTIIMHPQVWKCSGHYDLFHDFMVDCKESKKRYRYDQIYVVALAVKPNHSTNPEISKRPPFTEAWATLASTADEQKAEVFKRAGGKYSVRSKNADDAFEIVDVKKLPDIVKAGTPLEQVIGPDVTSPGSLTEPREFNLMFKTIVGALGGEDDAAFLRPETAQGIFVNFKNVVDSSRVKIPFGIAQVGKSFRNEITPRNFTFRSREFEQMEIEFFCKPATSHDWYKYWRDRRYQWYLDLGLPRERLQLRDHHADELSHYSTGTADIEYAFPFLPAGEFGELEGIAHRGDFDLRSHMEGKLDPNTRPLQVELGSDGKPKHRGSGKDLTYFDDQARERFTPHVIEPSAGADRATLAFLCEAYQEDTAPDENGKPQERVVLKLHPRLAPIKAAVLPLVKKDGMPEAAQKIYRALKKKFNAYYDDGGAVGRRYRRQDEVGTPYCITVDGQTLTDGTVTVRDRDSLKQWRIKADDCPAEIAKLVSGE
ncbi:MAG: glycine--tRNA ligase [Planctomycetaceae bacterium]|nr:glycine--tRNA ligase [Planctomycetaceae bacterium]